MKNKINIKFACDKSWSSMTPVDSDSRLCTQCNKKIIDFSTQKISDPQKIHCGHFSLKQIKKIQRQITLKRFSVLTLSFFSLLGVVAPAEQALGQTKTEQSDTTKKSHGNITIYGVIKDKLNNMPLPFVDVVVKSGDTFLKGTMTTFNGEFSLSIDTTTIKLDQMQLVFSYAGDKQDTLNSIKLSKELIKKEITISLETVINLPEIEIINFHLTGLIDSEPIDKKNEPKKK